MFLVNGMLFDCCVEVRWVVGGAVDFSEVGGHMVSFVLICVLILEVGTVGFFSDPLNGFEFIPDFSRVVFVNFE